MTQPDRDPRPRSSPPPTAQPRTAGTTHRWVVDRIEGRLAVLEGGDSAEDVVEVVAERLPRDCIAEGAVLDVPRDEGGAMLWEDAVRNRAEEQRRHDDAARSIRSLQHGDDGGDLSL